MAIDAGTPVPTVVGWIMAREVRKGDHVFDKEGKPARVTLVQTYTAKDMYRVTFKDGTYIEGDEHMVLPVQTPMLRIQIANREYRAKTRKYSWPKNKDLVDYRPVTELLDAPKSYSVPTTKAIWYREEPHPVPPFVMGLWASGWGQQHTFALSDEWAEYVSARFSEYGHRLKRMPWGGYKILPDVQKSLLARYTPMPMKIPDEYFLGTPEQRIEVLRGFVMARPKIYNAKRDIFTCRSTYRDVPRQIQTLCESLGMSTSLVQRDSLTPWTISFRTRIMLVPTQTPKGRASIYERRMISSIEKIQPRLCAHIETESASFAAGEGYIQCH